MDRVHGQQVMNSVILEMISHGTMIGARSLRAVNIYCCLYWAYALIRHYLRTGRKYAFIKKHVLNKHVCLLIRLYGSHLHHRVGVQRACQVGTASGGTQ